jgi:pyridoxamine 5'-phosphate oxidase
MSLSLKNIRQDYKQKKLNKYDIHSNPFKQFEIWLNEALDAECLEPTATTLATVGKDNIPSARTVLLKAVENSSFIFFTNYQSHKGKQIAENPYASLLFFWPELERQVRIEGETVKTSSVYSDEYFESRPRESQIGTWISEQSKNISNRVFLEDQYFSYKNSHKGKTIKRPPYWGGYALKPFSLEFWQGRSGRLHDRLKYTIEDNEWIIKRLAP